MAYTEEKIKQLYADQLAEQKKAIQSAATQSINQQKELINKAPSVYQPQRNQVYTTQAQQERINREALANRGLSGTGGSSLTLQNQNDMNFKSNLGSIDKQQQDYINTANQNIMGINTQVNTDIANARAANSQNMLTALQQQAAQAEAQRQFNEQMALNKQTADFEKAWALYQSGKITADTFKNMTGITVKKVKSSGKKGAPIPDPLADYEKSIKDTADRIAKIEVNPAGKPSYM